MTPAVHYIVQTQVCLVFFYVLYLLCLHRKISFRLCRIYLLVSIPVSFLLPLVRVPIGKPVAVTGFPAMPEAVSGAELAAGPVIREEVYPVYLVCIGIYLAGAAVILGTLIMNIIKLNRLIACGEKKTVDGKEVIVSRENEGAFSLFGKIIVARKIFSGQHLAQILRHEQWHGKLNHSADISIMYLEKIFLWFNPVVWHMEELLREVHEYEVDERLIKEGTDPRGYTRLLIDFEMGFPAPVMAPSFSYISVKNRIKMISRIGRRKKNGRLFLTVPLSCLYLAAFCITPAKGEMPRASGNMPTGVARLETTASAGSAVSEMEPSGNNPISGEPEGNMEIIGPMPAKKDVKVNREEVARAFRDEKIKLTDLKSDAIPFSIVDEKPRFRGGDQNDFTKWVYQQVVYPRAAKEQRIQGRVMLTFTINERGEIGNVKVQRGANRLLDAEALRVVKKSPRWEPGKMNGEVVKTAITFPIIFQLR